MKGLLECNSSIGFSGQISVIVLAGAVGGVIRIQMSGAIWVGRLMSDVFQICIEHFKVISGMLFAYRDVMHVGGFEIG